MRSIERNSSDDQTDSNNNPTFVNTVKRIGFNRVFYLDGSDFDEEEVGFEYDYSKTYRSMKYSDYEEFYCVSFSNF
jgi:hypothetical protein